ncbi:hypothetical protein ABZ686_07755, partial [Streptomyces sp. NPDC006992]
TREPGLRPAHHQHRTQERSADSVGRPSRKFEVKRFTDVRNLYKDSHWGPKDGWRGDEEVIAALRALITEHLAGTAEDIPATACPLPEDVGAAVTIGYDEHGEPHPLAFVRTDIPSGLRADLWGFCVAASMGVDHLDVAPDEHGIYYVGMERSPVTRPGPALLAALIVQRMGRRPGDCAFSFITPPTQGEGEPAEPAAA